VKGSGQWSVVSASFASLRVFASLREIFPETLRETMTHANANN
jgi:hypothetical protein